MVAITLVRRSRGRRLLVAVIQQTTAREVAARCGVVPSCVSEWLSGDARPNPRAAERLANTYRIPVVAWTVQHAPTDRD
jgi:transcriptional regulator with XRE-family HTH domain